MSPRLLLSVLTVAALDLATPSRALADGKAVCVQAAASAQRSRDVHKLVQARESLLVCAASTCPSVVQKDCVAWLAEVEQGLPTVVITAKDDTGKPLFDVRVSVDGELLALKLQGEALPVNPGAHALHCEAGDGRQLDQQVLVKEGVKNQSVDVVLAGPARVAAPPVPTPALSSTASLSDAGQTKSNPLRTVGWTIGGVGLAGLAVGAVFGVVAISDKSSAHCNASSACEAGPLSDARSAATFSTIGIIAGGALAAGGLALVLFAPKAGASPSRTATLMLSPQVSSREGGLVLGGAW